jgi:hypothetical protein
MPSDSLTIENPGLPSQTNPTSSYSGESIFHPILCSSSWAVQMPSILWNSKRNSSLGDIFFLDLAVITWIDSSSP